MTPCHLSGYPGIALLDDQGKALPFQYQRSGDQMVTAEPPGRVDLSGGGIAHLTINKYRCDLGDRQIAVAVSVIPPDDTQALRLNLVPTVIGYCGVGDPGSSVAVSPVEPTFADTLASH